MRRPDVIHAIIKERNEQIKKWGNIHHSPIEYISLLIEELGEASRHSHELHWNGKYYNVDEIESKKNLITELTQVAALCVAAMESIDDSSGDRT